MTVLVGRIRLTVRAPHGAPHAGTVLHGARSALRTAFADAAAAETGSGVVRIRHMRVHISAPLRALGGAALAHAIADACIAAAATRSPAVSGSGGRAAAIVAAAHGTDGVRCATRAEDAAAWLVALASDDALNRSIPSPYDDLAHLPSAAAFVALLGRIGDAAGLLDALGAVWSGTFASRCTPAEARAVLEALDDHAPATPETAARARVLHGRQPAGLARTVRTVLTALTLHSSGDAGAVTAARAAAAPLESRLTGAWLLLPFLRRHVAHWDEDQRRAIALALVERVAGDGASDDPAVHAWLGDANAADLRSALPERVRLDRILVATVRDFSRSLRGWERSRPTYILERMLRGQATVETVGDTLCATLPDAPLRIVLQRSSPFGPVEAPWASPKLALVPEDA